MKKFAIVLAGLMIISLVGCSAKKEEASGAPKVESIPQTEVTESVDEEAVSEVVDEIPPFETFDSALGYTALYYPNQFDVESSDGYDRFACKIDDENNYISISINNEYTKDDLMAGLILQSGKDDVNSGDSTFGEQNLPSSYISYETEDGYRMQFTLIERDNGVFVIETGMHNYGDDEGAWYSIADPIAEVMNSIVFK